MWQPAHMMFLVLVLGAGAAWAAVNGGRQASDNIVGSPANWYTKTGAATNCGSKNNFTLTWDPDVIRVGDTEKINFDFTPDVDFSGRGKAYFTVWLPQSPEPIYKGDSRVECNDIKRFMPKLCPIHKGQRVRIKDYKYPVVPTIALPQGTFHGKIRLENNNTPPEDVICIELTITVKD